MPQVKGTALRGLLKSVKQHEWPIAPVLALLPAEDRPHFERPIEISRWYPYSALVSLTRAIDRLHGDGTLALIRGLGREGSVRDLSTTFKIIATITSLRFVVGRAHLFWGRYCDTGQLILDEFADLQFKGRMEDFPGIDRAHCLLIEGWVEGMADALGAEGASVSQTRCVHRGDPRCEFLGTWTGVKGAFAG